MLELNDLSCLFTWELNEVNRTPDTGITTDIDEDAVSCMLFLKVMYTLTTAYDLCENNSLENAMKDMEEAENSFGKLKQQVPNGLSMKAVEHVVKGTKCFILQKMNKSNDVKSVLETIPLCEDSFDLGTLYGCQSAVWSYYYYTGWKKSMEYASKAIKLNPQSGMWHFLLANSLRRIRRSTDFTRKPMALEQQSFETAFELQAEPFFGIYTAQVYREANERQKAKEMYNTIFDMPMIDSFIYLKLALGFISFKDYKRACACLDDAEKNIPENDVFLHYKGIYLQNCLKDYQGALRYFEKAGASKNFVADISYMSLQMRLTQGRYDPLPYLKSMFERYGQFGGYRVQAIYMHMGAYYDLSRADAKNACKYYLQAIEIDPKCHNLKKFYSPISNTKFSVFDILRGHILPKLKRLRNPDDTVSEMIKKAEKYFQTEKESFEELMKNILI